MATGPGYLTPHGEIVCHRCREDAGGEQLVGEGARLPSTCDQCGAAIDLPEEAVVLQRLMRYLRYVGFRSRIVLEDGLAVAVPYREPVEARIRRLPGEGERFLVRFLGQDTELAATSAVDLYRLLLAQEGRFGKIARIRRHETRRALWHPEYYM